MNSKIKKNELSASKDCCLEDLILFHREKMAEQKALKNLLKALSQNTKKFNN